MTQSDDVRDFGAPLGQVTGGRLEMRRGAIMVAIDSDATMSDLYQAHFEGPVPDVDVQAGTVTIRQQNRLLDLSRRAAHLTLNPSVPWELDFGDGVVHLTADLSGLQLRRLQVRGAASDVDLVLARPTGTVPISLDGAARNVSIHRPAGVITRVTVHGSALGLVLDDQRFGGIAGPFQLATGPFDQAADRYLIDVGGAATDVRVDSRERERPTSDIERAAGEDTGKEGRAVR